jgi:hypothetical protein
MQGQPSDSQRPDLDRATRTGSEAKCEHECCAERDRSAQGAIIVLLLDDDHHGLWSREELQRTSSADALSVTDAIGELLASGLAHELGEFVFASRAARSFDRLDL